MRGETPNGAAAALRLKHRVEQLDYVRAMIRELRTMTAAERFEMLTLHLEMAYLEASDKLRELHSQQTPEMESRGTADDVDGRE